MRMIRNIVTGPPCCDRRVGRARLALVLVLLLLAVLLPALARGDELVAEAAFLADTLPPGARELSLSASACSSAPEPAPRVQLALALGERLGVTADVGAHRWGSGFAVDRPSGSVKLLLRAPAPDRTGVSLSLDLFGSAHRLSDAEVGTGVGAVRSIGRVTVRGALWGATPVGKAVLHAHAGASVATAFLSRIRVLGEVVGDLDPRAPAVAAGPTVKVALDPSTSVVAGALLGVNAAAEAAQLFVQLARGI